MVIQILTQNCFHLAHHHQRKKSEKSLVPKKARLWKLYNWETEMQRNHRKQPNLQRGCPVAQDPQKMSEVRPMLEGITVERSWVPLEKLENISFSGTVGERTKE